ncbi:uncharacterized protein, partial [Euwallacea similis]|uniref:uncharacterized protein n=1 Tax=Euwallacea similis TaxID=1736056 RepID=UPI00344CA9DE
VVTVTYYFALKWLIRELRNNILLFLVAIAAAVAERIPQVYEHLDEQLPPYIRLPRHLNKGQPLNIYQPQQDRLKSIYGRQQQADFRNLKLSSATLGPFSEDSDWKPFQPSFFNQKQGRSFDLNVAGSEAEAKASSDRQDQPIEYVYVSPNLLKSNLALHTDAAQQILENPDTKENHDINDLQRLLGKTPSVQLQGLQKLLDTKRAVEIEHNGSPPQFEDLQKQLDAVNKARADDLLAAAQKQAEAHIQAQHEAILKAQKQAQEEAFTKIEAHNRGAAHKEIPSSTPIPEVSALQERPSEQVLVSSPRGYSGHYASPSEDLRNAKPQIPVKFATTGLQIEGVPPRLYNPSEVQTYSPVSPYTFELVQHHQIPSTEATLVNVVPNIPHQTYQAESANQLHEDKVHEYAAKYSFGYRVLDEKQGNDYGHHEARDGIVTKGQYFVNLPDGRKQNVEYYSDKSGYHARVTYENIGVHSYVSNELAEHAVQEPVEEDPK